MASFLFYAIVMFQIIEAPPREVTQVTQLTWTRQCTDASGAVQIQDGRTEQVTTWFVRYNNLPDAAGTRWTRGLCG